MALALLLALSVTSLAASFADRYADAYHTFERGRFTQAIRQFRNLLAEDRNSDLSDNCQYWIGEAYYNLGQYEQALVEFDRVLAFPKTNKREDALFKIAQCNEQIGDVDAAKQLYARFLAEYPESRHSSAVLKKLETYGVL